MRYIVLLVFILFTAIGTAQNSNLKKHEIGLNLYSFNNGYNAVSGEYDYYFRYAIQHAYLNGLTYKYHYNNSAIRFGAQFQYRNLPYTNTVLNPQPGELYYGKIYNLEARLGWEHSFGTKKIKPIVSADFVFGYGLTDGVDGSLIGPLIDYVPYEIKNYSYGVSPSLGVSYQLLPLISIRLETNVNMGYYKQISRVLYYGWNQPDGVPSEGMYFTFNPISTLSVNFHF